MYEFLDNFTHHAAWQLLINTAVYNHFKPYLLPPFMVNASWYEGTMAAVIDGKLTIECDGKNGTIVDEVVYFNHSKFNEQ